MTPETEFREKLSELLIGEVARFMAHIQTMQQADSEAASSEAANKAATGAAIVVGDLMNAAALLTVISCRGDQNKLSDLLNTVFEVFRTELYRAGQSFREEFCHSEMTKH